jgi:hypothetical protein
LRSVRLLRGAVAGETARGITIKIRPAHFKHSRGHIAWPRRKPDAVATPAAQAAE